MGTIDTDKSNAQTDQWQIDVNTQQSGGSACLAYGVVWICSGSSVIPVDMHTGVTLDLPISHDDFDGDPRVITPWSGRIAVSTDTDHLYLLDPDSGAVSLRRSHVGYIRWMREHDGCLYTGGSEGIARYSDDDSDPLTYGGDSLRGNPSIGGSYIFYPYYGSGSYALWALDLETLEKQWGVSCNGAPDTPTWTDGRRVFYGTWSGRMYGTSLETQKPWQVDLPEAVETQPAGDNNVVCFVSGRQLYIYSPDGDPRGTINLDEGAPRDDSILADGILYLTSSTGLYAIEVDRYADSQPYIFLSTESNPFLIGTSGDIVYFGSSSRVYARSFKDIFGEYYAESRLVQDYDFSDPNAPRQVPRYTTEVTLFETNGAPRAGTEVRIWASEEASVTIGGVTTRIDHQSFVQVTTDAGGKLRVESDAESLALPDLELWAAFMEDGERIVVNRDGKVHDDLANLGSSAELDLATAKNYEGNALLSAEYGDDDAIAAITQGIRSTMEMSAGSSAQTRDATGDTYLVDGNAPYEISSTDGDKQSVPAQPKVNYTFSLADGSPSYQELDAEQAALILDNRQATSRDVLDDVWGVLKSGEAELVELAVAVEGTGEVWASIVVEGIEDAFTESVDTIEKVVILAESIFRAVVDAFEDVLEWLSHLWDWARIVEVHNDVRELVLGGLSELADQDLIDQLRNTVKSDLNSLGSNADQALESLISELGPNSYLDYQGQVDEAGGGDDGNSAQDGAVVNWLTQKVMDNIAPQLSQAYDYYQEYSGSIQTPSVSSLVTFPSLDVGDATLQAVTVLVDKMKTYVGESVQQQITDLFHDYEFDSLSELLELEAAEILRIVEDDVDLFIDILNALVDAIFDVLQALAVAEGSERSELESWLDGTISIPFISDLYQYLTGESLTYLSLFAWLAAVPAVLYESSQGARSTSSGGTSRGVGVLSGCLQLINAGFFAADATLRASGNKGMQTFAVASSAVTRFGALAATLTAAGDGKLDDEQRDAAIRLWFYPTGGTIGDITVLVGEKLLGEDLSWVRIAIGPLVGVPGALRLGLEYAEGHAPPWKQSVSFCLINTVLVFRFLQKIKGWSQVIYVAGGGVLLGSSAALTIWSAVED